MSLWLRVGAGVTLATIFSCSVLFFRRTPDPVFHGRLASEWTRDLLSADYKVRGDAQTALQTLGETSVPQLRLLLQKETPVWEKYAIALKRWIPSFNYAGCDTPLCHQRGAEMAGMLGPKARATIPDLVELLKYDSGAQEAERALPRIGPDALPQIENGLRHRDVEVRRRCARLLGDFGPLRHSSIAALIAGIRDPAAAVRKEAATTLGRDTAAHADVAAALLACVRDPASEVRAAAFASLGKIQFKDGAVTSTLRNGMSDAEPAVQLQAAKASWIIENDASVVVPVLVGILKSGEGWQAAYALGEIGPKAEGAIPALIEVLHKETVPRPFRTPPSSAYALGQIGPAAIPGLDCAVEDRDSRVRMSAVMAFGFMGKTARSAVPKLLPLLKDPDAEVQHATALTLAAIGAEPEQIMAGLTACLQAEDIYMRFAAAQVLREMWPEKQWVIYSE